MWERNHIGLAKGSEAYTRTHFLDPLLAKMAWQFIPEKTQTKHKRPDYWLFVDEARRVTASEADSPAQLFALSASVLEAKQFTHPLDAESKKDTPGQFPSDQVQGYLAAARDSAGKRYFNWAILTNGRKWRLYSERAGHDAYFEFVLADEHSFSTRDEFSTFAALFTPAAFVQNAESRCPLDDIQNESLSAQADLEENLRRRIFDVLEELAAAFTAHAPNSITDAHLADGSLYDACLVFLYRLLFVLYAESRYLLPVRPHGEGSNRLYREKFSLRRLVEPLRQTTTEFTHASICDLYEDLLKLFRLIDGENEELNEEARVTRYNGGLFAADTPAAKNLTRWRIPDPALARVLRQLIFAQPPAKSSARQQRIFTDDAIDYSTLEVRQLGDIYEGLLGGQLSRTGKGGALALTDENGENHRHGIFYTPDWVVTYLLRTTLDPLLSRIEQSAEVQTALKAKTNEERWNDSFAHGALALNLVDPAMGSGHFLVRATEYLGERIVRHPTTRRKTERIVTSGDGKRTKAQIEADGKIPVPKELSQEDAEIAYWRRRVVEACIYGVDINPMAVELAKLSLWLTCIAIDEPLNFLEHHLRPGNSLLSARAAELSLPPHPEVDVTPLQLTDVVEPALREVIGRNIDIEAVASTRMELVKKKERMWREARRQLGPLLRVADLWLGAVETIALPELDYLTLARLELAPDTLGDERPAAETLRASRVAEWDAVRARLAPFHWEIEFPDVFFGADGALLPEGEGGFHAVLGNPPYVSTQTSSGQAWVGTLLRRWGYSNDLYVFFTELGFRLLCTGGRFGFIVSDTFFTLASKTAMRELLQSHRLDVIGQCDPFDATVDAAIFVAEKSEPSADEPTTFVQARYRWREDDTRTEPDKALPLMPGAAINWTIERMNGEAIAHGAFGDLRLHRVPLALWRSAHKRAFFEPRLGTLRLFVRFNDTVKRLHAQWWEKIEDYRKVAANSDEIAEYHVGLKPGNITLVGLVADGAVGLQVGNNGRFVGYLEGTPQARAVLEKRSEWTQRWLADVEIAARFRELLLAAGGTLAKPMADSAAWEATVEPLRAEFTAARLGFGKMDLYRTVPKQLIAGPKDFEFAWQERKKELWERWRTRGELQGYWSKKPAARVSDAEFCHICGELQAWVVAENELRKKAKTEPLPKDVLGLRSAESYDDPKDAPRVATIYSGLRGRAQFVVLKKGDPDGSRWIDNQVTFIEWTRTAVDWMMSARSARWQGHTFFLREGITWTRVANHVAMKARIMPPCIFDTDSVRLTPMTGAISAATFLALFNSDIVSFLKMRFLQHTAKWEIGNIRQIPLVIPTPAQTAQLERLAELAMAAKRDGFAGEPPADALVAACRSLDAQLLANAPAYLHPPRQAVTFQKPDDCLAVIERAVNWEAEQLYGVAGLGPFDEF